VELTVAALYDVHGNLPALEAVLAEIDADLVVFGGDLVWGAWPRESLELALALGDRVRFIRGNTDRMAVMGSDPSSLWVQARLTEEQRELVLGWPETLSIDGVLYCHATPRSDEEIVSPASPESRWEEVLAGVEEHVVVCGHTHLQFDEEHAGHRIVNPGSVGNPSVRATAWWARVGMQIELRSTDYDTHGAADAWIATGYPRTDFAEELRTPWTRQQLLDFLESR
jgi:putative phosphoesterase